MSPERAAAAPYPDHQPLLVGTPALIHTPSHAGCLRRSVSSAVSLTDYENAKQEIKLRSPIEEVVRERVPELKRAGALWQACCPFHQEKSPSFKVDPRRGTWHCYGACGTGGDVIEFIKRHDNVDFADALATLAARCGVRLPERRDEQRRREESEPRFEVLARAEQFYAQFLRRPEGAEALAYLRKRGLRDETLSAFGIGFSPPSGRALVEATSRANIPVERLVELGLARVNERGPYDFFRGRVMFPVRDDKGRTLGFGARRLSDDDAAGPKYVNTPETPVFHKGHVFYALNHALEHVRRSGHLIVVEGYTDVMAAHQVGLRTVVAVLGTATTEFHAALVRRSGARRISLLFDGDEAGRKATVRALGGLLSLDVAIDVVRIRGNEDPCDVLVRDGVAPIEAALAVATPWFDFLLAWVSACQGDERYRALDSVLSLVGKLARPIARDDLMQRLATELQVPVESVRAQFESLPERRAAAERARREQQARAQGSRVESASDAATGANATAPLPAAVKPSANEVRLAKALRGLAAAALIEPTLAKDCHAYVDWAADPELKRILEVLAELHARTLGTFALEDVFNALGEHSARAQVSTLVAHGSNADSAQALFNEESETIYAMCLRIQQEQILRDLSAGVAVPREQLLELEQQLRSSFNRGNHV